MSSSTTNAMWNAIERNALPVSFDHLHKHLAAALTNDAQYWDDSISPHQVRAELNSPNPIRSMKWLLASISKGRDVSAYYPDVIKLVGGNHDLQVRKLVYTYMNQHCNDVQYQQLSLLSINSLQRGLDDPEPLIRAMAIRAMAGLQLPDVVQIQVLAIQRCIKDQSPYVRKCAVTAVAKLKHANLLPLVIAVLHHDTATMVLSSAMICFYELTIMTDDDTTRSSTSGAGAGDTTDGKTASRGKMEYYLAQLHPCFRKLCLLLTDMDEWGQVVSLEILMRYCRLFFREPRCYRNGSAELIDTARRVVRNATDGSIVMPPSSESTTTPTLPQATNIATPITRTVGLPPPPRRNQRIIKRRIVKKGFYSDEEDQSTEEEVYADTLENIHAAASLSNSLREPEAFGSGSNNNKMSNNDNVNDYMMMDNGMIDKEEADLDDDHRRLLTAAMPLLKSRNAGVVLAVCALQFYCGVSSVRVRKSIGKALVRMQYRDHPETQYVTYTSIRRLVTKCPSAFSPYLHDFFVLQMDPPPTRLAKLDILTSLALDPPSIETVLNELRHYIQWQPAQDAKEVEFICAAVAAVGRVAELAKICYARQSRNTEATTIVLNCLHGLVTVSMVVKNDCMIVGESVICMQRILKLLQVDTNTLVVDPNQVREKATKRITLLLWNTLSKLCEIDETAGADDDDEDEDDSDDDEEDLRKKWSNSTLVLPPSASAAAIHWLAELFVSEECFFKNHLTVRREIARLLAKGFVEMEEIEKEQALYFAFRLLHNVVDESSNNDNAEQRISERILGLGRVDTSTNIRDRARMYSNWANLSMGLKFDREALDEPMLQSRITCDEMKKRKIQTGISFYPSYLPFEKEDDYHFGSLSSLMGHKAHESYRPLPDWASENSPASLREETAPATNGSKDVLYRNEETSADDSSDSSQEYEDDTSESDSDSDSEESFSDSDTDSDDETDSSDNRQNGVAASEGLLLSPILSNSKTSDPLIDLSKGLSYEKQSGQLLSLHPQASIGLNSGDSIINDLRDIVLEPCPATTAVEEPGDFGEWFTVVRPDHSGGLAVRARYIRGQTKTKHATSMGFLAGSSSLLCMQFLFDNVKGSTPFRHIRIIQRMTNPSTSTISPARVATPPELSVLGVGEKAEVVVVISFNESSDRDGSMLAKLEVKFGSGGIPFEVRPRISDLLLPCTRTIAEFDSSIEKMHGFNRMETKVASTLSLKGLTTKLLSSTSLTPVKPANGDDGKRTRLVGMLPSSSELVYVQLEFSGMECKLIICCAHALVLSPLMNQLKKALISSDQSNRQQ